MAFKNVGTYNLDKAVSGSAGAANAGAFTMDAAGIASGQAFLTAELEKRDTLVRTPLTSFTYARDIPIRVGGGANGIPMVQADFSKGQYKTHVVAAGTRVMWVDLQRGNMTGRNMDSLLRDGLRLTYDKHMDENTYVGFSRFGTTGLLNNPDVTVTNAATNGATTSSTKFKDKTPDQILKDINEAILLAWNASENDNAAIPNHIIMPYEQFNYLATTKVTDLAEKTILTFLLENNVAKQNGSDLVIAATKWCKGAGDAGVDRMVVYRNEERFLAMDELVPLTRAMTSSNTNDFCFDTAYAGNLSEVEMFYDQTMLYVDGI